MPRFHRSSEGDFPFTAAEETERDAEEAAAQNAKPMKDWEIAMAATDAQMPRYIEDILDMIGTTGLNATMAGRYNDKKALRASKPQSGK